MSPGATLKDALTVEPLTLTCPARTAAVAKDLERNWRVVHNQTSTRKCHLSQPVGLYRVTEIQDVEDVAGFPC